MIRRSVSIVEAGEILGMTRSAAYRAAKAGEIHTISIGSRYLVPVAWLEELLGETLDLGGGDARPELARRDPRSLDAGVGT